MEKISVEIEQKSIECDFGTKAISIIPESWQNREFPLISLRINNEVLSPYQRLEIDSKIEPIYLNEIDGLRIYRLTLCFLVEAAAHICFPNESLIIDHSLERGYFFHFESNNAITQEEIDKLESKVQDMIDKNVKLCPRNISYKQAIEWFKSRDDWETLLLMENMNKNSILVNECEGYRSLHHSTLAPSASLITAYEFMSYDRGFLLRFPPSTSPLEIQPFKDVPLLFSVYQEHKNWGRILEVDCVGRLNQLSMDNKKLSHFINVAEALHEKKISQIAEMIGNKRESVKTVLIAGPSSSGKTTFTKRLGIQLQAVGLKPLLVSLDDYYLPHDKVPKDVDGKPDFEDLYALDVNLLNQNLLDFFNGEEVEFPIFDFKKGGRLEKGRILKNEPGTVLLMEGIHGLNEKLTEKIDSKNKFKIYISALTQLNLDDHNRISTSDNRIIRRMVRDFQFRGYSAITTLEIWPSVKRGERKHIFPYQNSADVMFNSTLDYEISVLKVWAEPLLRSVKPTERAYSEACRLLEFLSNFSPISSTLVPKNSILREFVGESGFKY